MSEFKVGDKVKLKKHNGNNINPYVPTYFDYDETYVISEIGIYDTKPTLKTAEHRNYSLYNQFYIEHFELARLSEGDKEFMRVIKEGKRMLEI